MTYEAVVLDFGGVLTSSVFSAFRALGRDLGVDPDLPLSVLAKDAEASRLLVEHEEGRLPEREFERGLAARMREHAGPGTRLDDPDARLLVTLQQNMTRDDDMVALVDRLRERDLRVGLLSNALGDDCYEGFDLDAMFDAVVISSDIGVRKPSRAAYLAVCERLGARPEATIMVDDLRHNLDGAARLGITGVLHRDAATTTAELERLLGETDTTTPGDGVRTSSGGDR